MSKKFNDYKFYSDSKKIRYDEVAKQILSHKVILSRILKGTLEEYKDIPLETIEKECIENPQVGSESVVFGGPMIEGVNSESTIPDEGKVSFDVIFNSYIPGEKDTHTKVIINVEAQYKKPGQYDLVTRGIFYCARMLSRQYGVEFKNSQYQNIKKVVSIWICMEPGKQNRNTITRYSIKPDKSTELFQGKHSLSKEQYDKIEVIIINLAEEYKETDDELLKFLDDLFLEEIDDKIELLQDKYSLFNKQVEEEVKDMCNLSDYVFDKGVNRGREEGREKMLMELLKENIIDIKTVAEKLKISEADVRERI